MKWLARFARSFGMTDEVWRRHANPWSVWTRFAAIPAIILAVWSRAWIGWWSLVPIALVAIWLWLNPRVFAPAVEPLGWAARGIYGEKLWLEHPELVPPRIRGALRWLALPGLGGLVLLAGGLVALEPLSTLAGVVLVTIAQLWRIDQLGRFYRQDGDAPRHR
jgi:hypothetical protein